MAEKSFYLKPTKTIELNHTPTDSEIEAHLLICDDSDEGIYYPLSSENEGPYDKITSIFEFSGILPEDYVTLQSIDLICEDYGCRSLQKADGTYEYSLLINDQIFTKSMSFIGQTNTVYIENPYVFQNMTEKDNEKVDKNMTSSLNLFGDTDMQMYAGKLRNESFFKKEIINFPQAKIYLMDYIQQYNKLPAIQVSWSSLCKSIYLSEEDAVANSNTKIGSFPSNTFMRLKNMQIKITYNTTKNKIQLSNGLTSLKNAYIKNNGQWDKLNENELKNIIINNNYHYSSDKEKYPMLLPEQGWKKDWNSKISYIYIEDNHIPDQTCKNSWPADISENGDITCYRYNNKIVISGNGSGGIYLHPNSKNLFKNNTYSNKTIIKGIELLHTYDWTNVEGMFYNCYVRYADLSDWKIYNLKNLFCFGEGVSYDFDAETPYGFILPKYIDYIPTSAFLGSNIFPKDVGRINIIGENAFFGSNIEWPAQKEPNSNTIAIMDGAFQGSENGFQTFFLPDTVKFIGNEAYAFIHGNLLKKPEEQEHESFPIVLPPEIEYIGKNAFYCANLSGELILPETLKYLGAQSFYGNDITGTITIPPGIKKINTATFGCTNIDKAIISEGITEISYHAFTLCPNLTEIQIPKSVNKIFDTIIEKSPNAIINIDSDNKNYKMVDGILIENNNTILFCDASFTVENFTIPNNITKIGNMGFYYTNNLTQVTIPSSVREIGEQAFDKPQITNIIMKGKTPPKFSKTTTTPSPFYKSINLIIQVPNESLSKYKEAWPDYEIYIVGY